MEERGFDHIIKSKLEEVSRMDTPSDWNTFYEQYSAELNAPDIDGGVVSDFDSYIKSKLSDIAVPASTGSDWNTFEAIYSDSLGNEDDAFDSSLSEKIQALKTPFNSAHWVLLKKRLEREEFIKTNVYFSKIAECAIVFLILFTFLNIFHDLPPEALKNRDYAYATKDDVASLTKQKPILIEDASTSRFSEKKIEKKSTLSINPPSRTIFSETDFRFIPVINRSLRVTVKNSSASIMTGHAADKTIKSSRFIAVNSLENSVALLDGPKMDIYRVKGLVTPMIDEDDNGGDNYLGLTLNPTVNLVSSPIDYINNLDAYNTDALGMDLGVVYGYEKNRIGLETGLFYGKKSYQPRIYNEVSGNFSEGYTSSSLNYISFDVLRIPFSIRYIALKNKSWNLYASAGSSFNVVTFTDYQIEQNGVPIQRPSEFSSVARNSSLNYTSGAFEGGEIHDNLFLTVDFSLGIESKLSESTSMFTALYYNKHIGLAGIGPNNDRLHSIGMNIGFKKKI